MKRKFMALTVLGLSLLGMQKASAQRGASYQNGLGLFIDAGNGGTFVGPHFKHYFNANDAGQINLLFGQNTTILGFEYSYNKPISGARGLKWNIGVGPQVEFHSDKYRYHGYEYTGKSTTDVSIRPMLGLEYKIPGAPIAMGFDWRPWWRLTHGNNFEAGRFGIAFKYTF